MFCSFVNIKEINKRKGGKKINERKGGIKVWNRREGEEAYKKEWRTSIWNRKYNLLNSTVISCTNKFKGGIFFELHTNYINNFTSFYIIEKNLKSIQMLKKEFI